MSLTQKEDLYQDDFSSKETAQAYFKYGLDHFGVMSDILIQLMRRFLPERSDEPKNNKFGTLVDIGCGNGRQTLALLKYFNRAIGIDISDEQISIAKEVLSQTNTELLKGRGEAMPLGDDVADVIIGMFVAYFMNMNEFIKEAKRVLKSGGIALLSGYMIDDLALKDNSRELDASKIKAASKLWDKCRTDFLHYAESISHPQRHMLQFDEGFFEAISGMKKRKEIAEFKYDLSINGLRNLFNSIPFFSNFIVDNPFEIMCRELKSLWKMENVEDENVNITLTCKVVTFVLFNE